MTLSPVLISAYSRPDHLKRCLESLQDCDFSENTDVFITIDSPLTSDVRGLNKENHSVAHMDWNFKSVNVISHEKNTDGEIIKIEAKRLLKKYGKVIMMEEDNIFSIDFLRYMNWALEEYESSESILSVSGWSPMDKYYLNTSSVYKYQGYCSWGVGLWESKSSDIIVSREEHFNFFIDKLSNISFSINYFSHADHLLSGIYRYFLKNHEAGDRYINLKIFYENSFSLYPGISRVRNIGNDGSGINCKISEELQTQRISSESESFYIEPSNDKEQRFLRRVYEHYRFSTIKKTIFIISFPFFYLFILCHKLRIIFIRMFK